ncbi:MAG TPA: DUF1800 family protein [Blastocatellia bacterium]|nr:DUF1800 family protein [Blastocatellia bacterium]
MRPNSILRFTFSLLLIFTMLAPGLQAAPPVGVTVAIDPVTLTLPAGSTRQYSVKVVGATNTAVTWTINNLPGGDATVGTISGTGFYTAPPVPPPNYTVTIQATSVADPTAFAAGTITVRNQVPYVTSVVPATLPPGPFSLTVNGSRFVNGAQVLWNNTPLQTNFVSTTQLTATGNAAQVGSFNVTVANPGPAAVSTPLTVKVVSTVVVNVTPASVGLVPGAAQQFQANVTGTPNTAVTWKVNGSTGGDPSVGTITQSGLYTAPNTVPTAGVVTVSALSQADNITQGTATVTIQDPLAITYGRFLDQATFGSTPQLMAHVRQVGIQAFLDEQFATPESPWPSLSTAQRSDAVDAFFGNALNGQDQLRQRVLFALSEIIVVAMNKNTNGNEIVPWLQVLSRNAFGNYRTLLREITLDASMGKYLDMVNSARPGISGGANENYAREVMQLFSIGLWKLNPDGSQQMDAQGNPMPTYTQTDVKQMALALTGWTYGNSTGIPPAYQNWNYYPGPMLPILSYHDRTQKTILGQTLAANQTNAQDLDGAIDILFNHPNVGPFLATRLIRALVTSNPSPAYIARVADAFNDNGQGVRGDMKAVIRAILMDAEARDDNPPSNFGRLRTPVQQTIAYLRALNMQTGQPSQFAYIFYTFGEGILDAPSVFGHYSPMYHVPKSPLFGPEFQIYSPTEAVNRANYLYGFMANPYPINPALQPFVSVAGNSTALINAVDNALLYGRMSPQMRTALINALPAMSDNNQRVMTVLYLTATSGDYLIQH